MFIVARGKYAEGKNFPGDLARGVILIGVPNLNIKSAKVVMKRKWYKQQGRSDHYNDWYER